MGFRAQLVDFERGGLTEPSAEEWCYRSLACFSTGRGEAFAKLPEGALRLGLDFVLGRGVPGQAMGC